MTKPTLSDRILFTNDHILVAHKPAGMPSVPDRQNSENLQDELSKHTSQDLQALTRLDRPVSGLLIYTLNPQSTQRMQALMSAQGIHKTYIAIVEGKVEIEQASLVQYLRKGQGHKSYISEDSNRGKRSELEYTVLKKLDNYTVLQVNPKTGRFHQIRAQLAHLGHPIKGDVKYGARRGNKDRSIHLHALSLAFSDPFMGEEHLFKAPLPSGDTLWKEAAVLM